MEVEQTLLDGILRLGLLEAKAADIRVLLLGTESYEAGMLTSEEKCREQLRDLLSALVSAGCGHLALYLVGPHMPIDDSNGSKVSTFEFSYQSVSVLVHFEHALFHECSLGKKDARLDAVFALNAGIWGYESWLPTLDILFFDKYAGVKIVITSYTMEESEDDYDRMAAYFEETKKKRGAIENKMKLIWEWDCEKNPNGSKTDLKRQTRSTEDNLPLQAYYASGFWQCLFSSKVKSTIRSTCSRCHTSYDPETNDEGSCLYHPESFCGETAQRWMAPGETEGAGNIHNFYSCCSNPDPNSPGCCATRHQSYDEPEDHASSWGRRPGMGI